MLASVAVKNHYNGARDPVRALPERDHRRRRAEVGAGVPSAAPARLLPADRRRGRRAARAGRAGRTSSPTSRCSSPASASRPTTRTCTRRTRSPRSRPRGSRRSARTRWPASARRRSTAPRCTTASRSPRSSTSRTSASSRRATAASRQPRGRDRRSTGRIPVNTSGGLLAKGHPIGATGVAQITECWWQLRGEAGERQVETRNGYALQHNAGGRGSGVSVVNILTNRNVSVVTETRPARRARRRRRRPHRARPARREERAHDRDARRHHRRGPRRSAPIPQVRAVLITGDGDAFCAGMDLARVDRRAGRASPGFDAAHRPPRRCAPACRRSSASSGSSTSRRSPR